MPGKVFSGLLAKYYFPLVSFFNFPVVGKKRKNGRPCPPSSKDGYKSAGNLKSLCVYENLKYYHGGYPSWGGAGVGPPSSAGPNKGFFKLRVDIGCGRYKLKKNANYSGVREVLRYLSVGNDRFTILTEGGLFE